MLTYNNKNKHSATGMTPKQASKKENEFNAMINVASQAKKEKKYPELEVGNKVKILRKKAITEKERSSNFLKGEYTVEKISKKLGQNYYTLQGFNRPLLRHELTQLCNPTAKSLRDPIARPPLARPQKNLCETSEILRTAARQLPQSLSPA